jgi:hypothetical protein
MKGILTDHWSAIKSNLREDPFRYGVDLSVAFSTAADLGPTDKSETRMTTEKSRTKTAMLRRPYTCRPLSTTVTADSTYTPSLQDTR